MPGGRSSGRWCARTDPGDAPGRSWADTTYHHHDLNAWLQDGYPGTIASGVARRTDTGKGFEPARWRWVIGRTNGWVERSRGNAPDDEKTTASGEAMVRITMMTIVPNRPTDERPEFPSRYPKKVA